MERVDFIPGHPDLKIIQDDSMFCINTDTEVLGEFSSAHKNDVVMDMGCNNGALMLYISLFNPKKIIGIDINRAALALAKRNMELNKINNAFFIEADIKAYSGDKVDVIVCNPPYFKTKEDNMSLNDYKNLAKHENDLTIDVLISSISRNLKDGGSLYFLHLSSRLDEVLFELRRNNLFVKEMKLVYDENKDRSNVFMIKAVKNGNQGMVVYKPIIKKR